MYLVQQINNMEMERIHINKQLPVRKHCKPFVQELVTEGTMHRM
jgi:hypothetical protein